MTEFFVIGLALVVYMSALFFIAILRSDNSTADIGYGIGCIAVVSTAALLYGLTPFTLIPLGLVCAWGLRLSGRIYRKNKHKPEDFRYRAWRESWGRWFIIRSFLQIYMLQGAIIFLVALPATLAIAFPREPQLFLVYVGILLWCIGYYFEAVADAQLDTFITQPANKGKILMEGLWRYSRHPNYFGESTMWTGLAVLASGLSAYPLVGFVSPILITYLLLRVSGVPLLEKRWKGDPEWEAYAKRTSVFFPLPPRQHT